MYGATPNSVFMDIPTIPRGPWFKEMVVQDDGLEYFYKMRDQEGNMKFLISNNLTWQDREDLSGLYKSAYRTKGLVFFSSAYVAFEIFNRIARLSKMGLGTKLVGGFIATCLIAGQVYDYSFNKYYGPMFAAFYKKYESHARADIHDIDDEKREWFEIDTSQYMNYDHDDLHHSDQHYESHNGPQPDGDVMNGTWFREMDKYLKGEESTIKEHPMWNHYEYEFFDKGGWPTSEDINAVFTAKCSGDKTPDSLKN